MRSFIPILLIITSGIVGYFRVMPLYESVRTLRIAQANVDEALGKTKEIGEAVVSLSKKIDTMSANDVSKLSSILPAKVDEVRFLNMLNSIAINHGISLDDFDISKEVTQEEGYTTKGISSIGVNFKVSTPYNVFKEFLKDLERSLTIIDVRSIKLSVPTEGNIRTNSYEYDVNISTYMIN